VASKVEVLFNAVFVESRYRGAGQRVNLAGSVWVSGRAGYFGNEDVAREVHSYRKGFRRRRNPLVGIYEHVEAFGDVNLE